MCGLANRLVFLFLLHFETISLCTHSGLIIRADLGRASLPCLCVFLFLHSIMACAAPTVEHEELACQVCFELYSADRNNPKILVGCGHTLCDQCVKKLLDSQRVLNALKCPFCNKETRVPPDGLPTNFGLRDVVSKLGNLNCNGDEGTRICSSCHNRTQRSTIWYCGQCTSENADGSSLVCANCAMNNHRDHNALINFQSIMMQKKEIGNKVKTELDQAEESLAQVQKSRTDLIQIQENLSEIVHQRFSQIKHQLNPNTDGLLEPGQLVQLEEKVHQFCVQLEDSCRETVEAQNQAQRIMERCLQDLLEEKMDVALSESDPVVVLVEAVEQTAEALESPPTPANPFLQRGAVSDGESEDGVGIMKIDLTKPHGEPPFDMATPEPFQAPSRHIRPPGSMYNHCYNCMEEGHLAKECSQPPNPRPYRWAMSHQRGGRQDAYRGLRHPREGLSLAQEQRHWQGTDHSMEMEHGFQPGLGPGSNDVHQLQQGARGGFSAHEGRQAPRRGYGGGTRSQDRGRLRGERSPRGQDL